MNITQEHLTLLQNDFFNANINSSIYYDNSSATAITFFDNPLTANEMDYFNNTINSLNKIITQNISLLSDEDFQYAIYYQKKSWEDLCDIYNFYDNKQIHLLEKSFRSEIVFENISLEQIIYLMTYCYFDKIGEDSHFSFEAKNGNVYFSHKTINNFSPRVRDKLSLFLSLFFDEKNNIFNGINSNNKKIIEPRNYLTLLDCHSYKKGKIQKYSYLMSQKNSLSTSDITWAEISQIKNKDIIANFYNKLAQFLFEDVVTYAETIEKFKNVVVPAYHKELKSSIKIVNHIENKEKDLLNLIPEKLNIRYNVSDYKFRAFFSDIKRTTDLYQAIHENTNKTYNIKTKIKGKI